MEESQRKQTKNHMERSCPQILLFKRKLDEGCSQVGLPPSGEYDLRLALGIHAEHNCRNICNGCINIIK